MTFPEYYFSTYERFEFDYQYRIAEMFATDDEPMTEDELDELAASEIQYDLENVLFDFCSHVCGKIVMTGHAGLWNGAQAGGSFFDDLSDFFDAIEYDELMMGTDDNGDLIVTCVHHDGRNVWTLRELTAKGEEYIEELPYWEVDTRKTIEHVFASEDLSCTIDPYGLF